MSLSIKECIENEKESKLLLGDDYPAVEQEFKTAFLKTMERILQRTIQDVRTSDTIPEINALVQPLMEYSLFDGVTECLSECNHYKERLKHRLLEDCMTAIQSSKHTADLEAVQQKFKRDFGDEAPKELETYLEAKHKKLRRKESIFSLFHLQ